MCIVLFTAIANVSLSAYEIMVPVYTSGFLALTKNWIVI